MRQEFPKPRLILALWRLTAPAKLAIVLLAVAVTGCNDPAVTAAAKKPEPPVVVQLVSPKRGDVIRFVSLPANITANQQATLCSKVAGYLKTINVDIGDDVKQGQLLAEIEVPELLADFARYKAEAEIADLDYKRASDGHQKSPDLVVLQSVDTAKAKSLMAKANLDRAESFLGFCRITAPFSGVITRREVDPGVFVPSATSGSAARNAAVVTLMDFNRVRVQVAVPENEVPLVRTGLPVRVLVDELPARTFEGSITRISQALDDSSRTMLAEIDLDNPKRELRPGMYAIARLGLEKHSDVVLIPVDAAVIEKSGTSVFIIADGKAKKVPVKPGFNDGSNLEILEGISPTQSVILVGKRVLSSGQTVNMAEVK